MDINFLKEQSVKLNEGMVTADVADTDSIIATIIEMKQYHSLAYQVCEVHPVTGPTGGSFALVYDAGKIKLLRNDVAVESDAIEETGFTLEVIQDLQSQYGKSANQFIAKALSGISSMNENRKLISKLASFSTSWASNLTLSAPLDCEQNMFEIHQKVAEIVLHINSSSYKSLESFCILPLKSAASILAMSNMIPEKIDAGNVERGLFLGANGRTSYYLNPDSTSTDTFVGICSETPGMSSLVLNPYAHTLIAATNPENGDRNVFNFNRYAIEETAMSKFQKMLYKFKITN